MSPQALKIWTATAKDILPLDEAGLR